MQNTPSSLASPRLATAGGYAGQDLERVSGYGTLRAVRASSRNPILMSAAASAPWRSRGGSGMRRCARCARCRVPRSLRPLRHPLPGAPGLEVVGSVEGPLCGPRQVLPAIVGERLVGLGHLVRVVLLLDRVAAVLRSVDQL